MREHKEDKQKNPSDRTIETHDPKPKNPGYDENAGRDDQTKRHPHQGNPPPGK